MEFSVKNGSVEKQRTACLVVGVFEPRRLSASAEQLDNISAGYISALLRRGDIEGKVGQTLLLHHVPNIPAFYWSVAVKSVNWMKDNINRLFKKQ